MERLADALVEASTHQATGLVVGLTGEWGSGKTSILNLLTEELRRRHNEIALLRFDPWLISGSEDLTRQFLADLFRAVLPYLAGRQSRIFSDYAEGVSAKALGGLITKTAMGWFSRKAPLAETKEALSLLLSNLTVPIVALIDELDRVQDDEIVATARLIRSVADFPNISYVVAYDPPRVKKWLHNFGR